MAGTISLFGHSEGVNRQTRPDYYNAYGGGIGIVPRRGWNDRTAAFVSDVSTNPVRGLHHWASVSPLVVLSALIDSHPIAQMALANDLSAAFGPDATRIVAVANESDKETDPDGTAAISALWASLPRQVGGLAGLQWTMGEQVCKFGSWCVEAILGEGQLNGLAGVATFDPLTTRFRLSGGELVFEQKQTGASEIGSSGLPVVGWQRLDQEFCLTAGWRGSSDNPYGLPRYGAFLSEGLADLSEQKDLRDWLHTVAWPRLSVAFPYNSVVEYARENPEVLIGRGANGGDLSETQYAALQFKLFSDKIAGMKADDVMMLPMGAEAKSIAMALSTGLTDLLSARRLRVVQSLDQLPVLVGITEGGGTTQGATEQSRSYYNKLRAFRAFVNAGLVQIANLHLRYLGLNLIARAETEPMVPRDKAAENTAEAVNITNTLTLLDNGFISDEDAAQRLTGSAVVDAARTQAAISRRMATPSAMPMTTKKDAKNADPAPNAP